MKTGMVGVSGVPYRLQRCGFHYFYSVFKAADYLKFEFKLDGTAAEGLRQIEDKGYARPYGADPRKLYKIGANFSSQTGTIEDWKVAE